MSNRCSDGDGALVIFGAVLGVLGMLGLIWLASLDGKSIQKDTKINVDGNTYRVINYAIDDRQMLININKLGD